MFVGEVPARRDTPPLQSTQPSNTNPIFHGLFGRFLDSKPGPVLKPPAEPSSNSPLAVSESPVIGSPVRKLRASRALRPRSGPRTTSQIACMKSLENSSFGFI